MGYDVHITRAEFWPENDDCQITESEWLQLVSLDPELRPDPGNQGYVNWTGPCQYPDPWFHWFKGNISTKNPDRPIVRKMLEIASRLSARVQGDDGEFYDDPSDFPDD